MDFPLYEDAILVVDLPDDGLVAGAIGTVVARHDVPELEPGYSLEFCDHVGKTRVSPSSKRPTRSGCTAKVSN
jgi:hypothetical protein